MKITKEDIKIWFKYGPIEFDIKRAMVLYYLIDVPIQAIVYFSIYFIKEWLL